MLACVRSESRLRLHACQDLRANRGAALEQLGGRGLHRRRHRQIGVGDDLVGGHRFVDLRRRPAEANPAQLQLRQPRRLRQPAEAEGRAPRSPASTCVDAGDGSSG